MSTWVDSVDRLQLHENLSSANREAPTLKARTAGKADNCRDAPTFCKLCDTVKDTECSTGSYSS